MIYLVHGDDLSKSRALITAQQKKLGVEKRIELHLEDTSVPAILDKTNSKDLFGAIPFVLVDCSKAPKGVLEELANNISKVSAEATLILLFDKELGKNSPFMGLGLKANLSNRLLEGNIFALVDSVYSKNRAAAYRNLEKLYKEDAEPFYIFSMLLYGLRNLALVIFDSPAAQKISPFVKAKTLQSARLYDSDKIRQLYKYYYELDKKVKTGEIDADIMVTLALEKVINS